MFDTSQQSGDSVVLQTPSAVGTAVSFAEVKKIREFNPETSLEDLKQLYDIVDQISKVFTRKNARWEIIELQKLILPLRTSLNPVELYSSDKEPKDPEVRDPNTTLFGTDIAAILAQVAYQLKLPGFTDKNSVQQYLEQYARAGAADQYTVAQLRKEYYRVIEFIKILYDALYKRLAAAGQQPEVPEPEELPEALQPETAPAEEPAPVAENQAVVAGPDSPAAAAQDGGDTQTEPPPPDLTPEQQAQIQAFSDHDRRTLLVTYQGLLASTAAFTLAADSNFTQGTVSDEQMALLMQEAQKFLQARYGDTIPELSFAERAEIVRLFQTSVVGKAIGLHVAFQQGLADVLGSTSPIVEKNIELTLDGMLQASGPKAIIEMLDTMDAGNADLVAQMFGIPQKLDSATFERLKTMVVLYAMAHGTELSLLSGNARVFARLEAAAPKITDPAFAQKVDSFRGFLRTYNAASGREDGSELLAQAQSKGAIDKKTLLAEVKKQNTRVQEMYGALWANLSEEERKRTLQQIATTLGEQPIEPLSYADLPVPLGIEIIPHNFYKQLATQVQQEEAHLQQLTAAVSAIETAVAQDQAFAETIEQAQQAIAVENMRAAMVESYLADAAPATQQEVYQQLGTTQNGRSAASVLELENWGAQNLGPSGFTAPQSVPQRLFGRQTDGQESKISQAIKRLELEIVSKGAAAISLIPGGGLALAGIRASEKLIGKKKTWALIAGGGLAGAGLLGHMLATSVLARLGGLAGTAIGGVGGGLASLAFGGTVAIPAVGVGALAGGITGTVGGYTADMAIRNFFGGNAGATTSAAGATPASGSTINPPKFSQTPKLPPSAPSTPTPTAPTSPTPGLEPSAASVAPQPTPPDIGIAKAAKAALANASIGTLAPLFAVGSVGFMSFITIFTIYAAFLVPLPGRAIGNSVAIPSIPGLQGCWPTTGTTWVLRNYFANPAYPHAVWDGSLVGFPGPGSAIDIMTNGTRPPIYTPFSGTATFYPWNFGLSDKYGHHVVVKTPQFALIFAHMTTFVNAIDTPSGTREISKTQVTKDVPVQAGDAIGFVGSTGFSSGPHLHYEVVGADILSILPITDQERRAAAADEKTILYRFVSPAQCAKPTESEPPQPAEN